MLVDKFLEDATEVDVDCITDVGHFADASQGTIVMGGVLEHIEFAGVHSGDAAMVLAAAHAFRKKVIETIREYTHAMARELKVIGLMNVQYAVKGETVYVLEVNPRASRTVPFVSKAIGVPLAKLAAVMAGRRLTELGFTEEIWTKYWAVKESVFPFNRFHGQEYFAFAGDALDRRSDGTRCRPTSFAPSASVSSPRPIRSKMSSFRHCK